jgi:serine/threonine protein kinase/WD40 repeat protein
MKHNPYSLLIEKNLPPKAFVENALRILEFRVRELALIGLDDWKHAEIPQLIWSKSDPELFNAIGRLQRPSWGHWSGLLRQLESALKKVAKDQDPVIVAKLKEATHLRSIQEWMESRVEAGRAREFKPLATLLGMSLAKKLTWHSSLDLCITLRNQIAHYSPSEASWWAKASEGLLPLIEGLAEQHDARPIHWPTPLPTPWFIADGSTVLSFGGMKDDFTPVYLGLGAEPRHVPKMTREVMVTFRQLLGAADADEENFRRLMARLLPEEQRGVQLGEYLVGKPVGEGGFARVHAGWQLSTGRKVAIKILRDGLPREYRERFQDEASYLGRLDHPGIVGVLGQGIATWTPREHADLSKEEWFQEFKRSTIKEFIALEFLEGRSLEQIYADPDEMPEVDELIEWFAQAAEALAAVHSLDDLVHRDVKPSNLIVSPEGQVKLLDFGIARSQVEARTMYTHLGKDAATPVYAAPEQLRQDQVDQVGPLSDVYSLCATFYELFCQARLYEYDVVGVAEATNRKLNGAPPAPPRREGRKIPWEVEVLLLDGLQADPSLRPHSALDLAEDLRRVQFNEPIHHRRPPFARRVALWGRRHKRPLQVSSAASLIVLLISLAIGATLVSSERAKNEGLSKATDLAKKDKKKAEEAAEKAKKGEQASNLVRRSLAYEKDMKEALVAWEEHRTGEVRELLKQHDPRRAKLDEDPRAFEWYYLNQLTATGVINIKSQGNTRAVVFSPDGRRVGVAGSGPQDGNFVRLYKADSDRPERTLKLDKVGSYSTKEARYVGGVLLGPVGEQALAFSPDGKLVAATCLGEVKVWDAETGAVVLSVVKDNAIAGFSVTFSPDGKFLLAGGYQLSAYAWEIASKQRAYTFLGPQAPDSNPTGDPVKQINFGTGRGFARSTGSMPNTPSRMTLWSLWPVGVGREQPPAVQPPTLDTNQILIGPSGQFGQVALVTDKGLQSCGLVVPSQNRPALRLAPNKKQANVARPDVALTDLKIGRIHAFAMSTSNLAVCSENNQVVVVKIVDRTADRWWSFGEQTILRGHDGRVAGLAVSSDGSRIAAFGNLTGSSDVTLWNVAEQSEAESILSVKRIRPVAGQRPFLPRDRSRKLPDLTRRSRWTLQEFNSPQNQPAKLQGASHYIEATDTTDPSRPTIRFDSPVNAISAASISSDGTLCALSGDDTHARDVAGQFVAAQKPGFNVVPVKDGTVTIQIVEPSPSRRVRVLKGLQFAAKTLAFDQSGKRLLSTSSFENVSRLWDVEKGVQIRWIGEHKSMVLQSEFSPDGRWIVSGDPTEIKVWPVNGTTPVASFTRPSARDANQGRPNPFLSWAIDGSKLAFAGENKRIQVWDFDKQSIVFEVLDLGRAIDHIGFLDDGRRLLTFGEKKVTFWSMTTGKEIITIPTGASTQMSEEVVERLRELEARWKAELQEK